MYLGLKLGYRRESCMRVSEMQHKSISKVSGFSAGAAYCPIWYSVLNLLSNNVLRSSSALLQLASTVGEPEPWPHKNEKWNHTPSVIDTKIYRQQEFIFIYIQPKCLQINLVITNCYVIPIVFRRVVSVEVNSKRIAIPYPSLTAIGRIPYYYYKYY